jgi:sugar lactone lactonase YvrE
MRRAITAAVSLLLAAGLYLLCWPVPVDPVAWEAPVDEGLTGAYTPNDILRYARAIDLGGKSGPEDIARGPDGKLFVSVADGAILELSRGGTRPRVFAETGGRPLGIESLPDGSLAVANAMRGLQRVAADGSVSILAATVNGRQLAYVNDVAVAQDGRIFFTEASTKFAAADAGGTFESSLLDILEHGGHGLLLEYRPADGSVEVLLDGLNFANGVAISVDQRFLLVAETGSYRILRYWLAGEHAGTSEVLIDNLPGFPDNINNGLNGRFWLGLAAPRNALLDRLAPHPLTRKIVQRLPAFIRPRPLSSSHVIAVNGDGEVLMNLQDPGAHYPLLTGVLELPDRLYLTTVAGPVLPYINKTDLF